MLTMALLVMWLCPLCVFADQQETYEHWRLQGQENISNKEYQAAAAAFSEAIKVNPVPVEAYVNRGLAYSEFRLLLGIL